MRRAGLGTGVAAGAFALAAPAAHALEFEVNSLGDGPADACDSDCTLRDAVAAAGDASGADSVVFASGLSGTIRLTEGEVQVVGTDPLTISGPGPSVVSVSGDADASGTASPGDSRIFRLAGGPTVVAGLTLTGGYPSGDPVGGGAIHADSDSGAVLRNVRMINNGSEIGGGGAVAHTRGDLTVEDSTLAGNFAYGGGGILTARGLTVRESVISGNSAGSRDGGGILAQNKYQVRVEDSVISGNDAANGGGISFGQGFPISGVDNAIVDTTISDNQANDTGAGLHSSGIYAGDSLSISRTTISRNQGGGGTYGGGLALAGTVRGEFDLVNSTISGNSATTGGGISLGTEPTYPVVSGSGTIEIDHSTIARNHANTSGGGIRLSAYPNEGPGYSSATIPLYSTIVADNTAGAVRQDLDRDDISTAGGFKLAWSLVERRGDAPVSQNPAGSSVIGRDPLLGPLANNGGPTRTHKPALASRAIDRGASAKATTVDQRGGRRRVDLGVRNLRGDGTDMGSVEVRSGARCMGRKPTHFGTRGPDRITGSVRPDVVLAFGGRDWIVTGPGADRICAGPGNDRAFGRAGNDRIAGGPGNDRVFGGAGFDRLFGQRGFDRLFGGPGSDRLRGGPGGDACNGGRGADSLRSC